MGGGRVGGRGRDETLTFEQKLNETLHNTKSVDDVLELVDRHAEAFDYIHVSTAVNKLQKLAASAPKRSSDILNRDARFDLLVKLIRYHHKSFKGQAVANVLHGLAALESDLGVDSHVDAQLAAQLARVAEREADGVMQKRAWSMNAQAVSNTLIALGKLKAGGGCLHSFSCNRSFIPPFIRLFTSIPST